MTYILTSTADGGVEDVPQAKLRPVDVVDALQKVRLYKEQQDDGDGEKGEASYTIPWILVV
ncbi:MAG: hypothetical protein LQ343_001830 [Gyalolechia ehrenbergii]|nr:MAG: hypothetical protein LQ343_001830 [Gyalolechia ehrenbergii]